MEWCCRWVQYGMLSQVFRVWNTRITISSAFSDFYRAMLCIRGTSHGPVSVCLSVTSRSSTKTAKQRITLVNNTTRWFCDYQGCRGDEISITYLSHTHRKSCGYPYRITIPTERQNPTYPYPHPVFSLQEAYFNLLFVTLTVGHYMMYVLCESFCDWSADWLVCIKRLLSFDSFDFENNIRIVKKYWH